MDFPDPWNEFFTEQSLLQKGGKANEAPTFIRVVEVSFPGFLIHLDGLTPFRLRRR